MMNHDPTKAGRTRFVLSGAAYYQFLTCGQAQRPAPNLPPQTYIASFMMMRINATPPAKVSMAAKRTFLR
jgi:hypothetical protein